MFYNNVALVVTGCVAPPENVPVLKITDSETRAAQYIESLGFYISHTGIRNIIFCENSDYPVDDLILDMAEKCGKEFEWLKFCGNQEKSARFGKGYGEGEILNYVFSNSNLIKQCNYMVKVTGRLKVLNLSLLILSATRNQAYFWIKSGGGMQWIDTRCYMMPCDLFSQKFLNVYEKIDDRKKYDMELVFYDTIKNNYINHKKFLVCPRIAGMSGSDGRIYSPRYRSNLKDTVHLHLLRDGTLREKTENQGGK